MKTTVSYYHFLFFLTLLFFSSYWVNGQQAAPPNFYGLVSPQHDSITLTWAPQSPDCADVGTTLQQISINFKPKGYKRVPILDFLPNFFNDNFEYITTPEYNLFSCYNCNQYVSFSNCFPFFDNCHLGAFVSSNGFISFQDYGTEPVINPSNAPDYSIFVSWTALDYNTVYLREYEDRIVILWYNAPAYEGTGFLTAELILKFTGEIFIFVETEPMDQNYYKMGFKYTGPVSIVPCCGNFVAPNVAYLEYFYNQFSTECSIAGNQINIPFYDPTTQCNIYNIAPKTMLFPFIETQCANSGQNSNPAFWEGEKPFYSLANQVSNVNFDNGVVTWDTFTECPYTFQNYNVTLIEGTESLHDYGNCTIDNLNQKDKTMCQFSMLSNACYRVSVIAICSTSFGPPRSQTAQSNSICIGPEHPTDLQIFGINNDPTQAIIKWTPSNIFFPGCNFEYWELKFEDLYYSDYDNYYDWEFPERTYNWVAIETADNKLNELSMCDNCFVRVDLNNVYKLDDDYSFNKMFIHINGFVTFEEGYSGPHLTVNDFSTISPFSMIYYRKFESGNVYFKEYDDYLILSYVNMIPTEGTGQLTAQSIVYRAGGMILYYQSFPSMHINDTLGIVNPDATLMDGCNYECLPGFVPGAWLIGEPKRNDSFGLTDCNFESPQKGLYRILDFTDNQCKMVELTPGNTINVEVRMVCESTETNWYWLDDKALNISSPTNVIANAIVDPYDPESVNIRWTRGKYGCGLYFHHYEIGSSANNDQIYRIVVDPDITTYNLTNNYNGYQWERYMVTPGQSKSYYVREVCADGRKSFLSWSNAVNTGADPLLNMTLIVVSSTEIQILLELTETTTYYQYLYQNDISKWIELDGDNEATYLSDLNCDDCYTSIDLTQPFNFYAEWHNKIYVSSNGQIFFSNQDKTPSPDMSSCCNQNDLPNTEDTNFNFIQLYYYDLNPTNGGKIYVKEIVDEVNGGTFIVEFYQVEPYSNSGRLTAEVIFHQLGNYQLLYKEIPTENTYSVGLENKDQTGGLSICFSNTCEIPSPPFKYDVFNSYDINLSDNNGFTENKTTHIFSNPTRQSEYQFSVIKLDPDTKYSLAFSERCTDQKGSSIWESIDAITYAGAPIDVTLTPNSEDSSMLIVTWYANEKGCKSHSHYEVYYINGTRVSQLSSCYEPGIAVCTLENLGGNIVYQVKVRQSCGDSSDAEYSEWGYSNLQSTTQVSTPVISLSLIKDSSTTILVEWSNDIGCDSISGSGGFQQWTFIPSTGYFSSCNVFDRNTQSCMLSGINPLDVVTVQLKEQCNTVGNSDFSMSNTLYIPIQGPTSASISSSMQLSWVPNGGCPSFSHYLIAINGSDHEPSINQCDYNVNPALTVDSITNPNPTCYLSDVSAAYEFDIIITEVCVEPLYSSWPAIHTIQRTGAYEPTNVNLTHVDILQLDYSKMDAEWYINDINCNTVNTFDYFEILNGVPFNLPTNLSYLNYGTVIETQATSTFTEFCDENEIFCEASYWESQGVHPRHHFSLSFTIIPQYTSASTSFSFLIQTFGNDLKNESQLHSHFFQNVTFSFTDSSPHAVSISSLNDNTIQFDIDGITNTYSFNDKLLNFDKVYYGFLASGSYTKIVLIDITFSFSCCDACETATKPDSTTTICFHPFNVASTNCQGNYCKAVVTNLKPFTEYSVKVREVCTNTDYSSIFSKGDKVFSHPEPPTNAVIHPNGTLSWTPGSIGCEANFFFWYIELVDYVEGGSYVYKCSYNDYPDLLNSRSKTSCELGNIYAHTKYNITISELCLTTPFTFGTGYFTNLQRISASDPYGISLIHGTNSESQLDLTWFKGEKSCSSIGAGPTIWTVRLGLDAPHFNYTNDKNYFYPYNYVNKADRYFDLNYIDASAIWTDNLHLHPHAGFNVSFEFKIKDSFLQNGFTFTLQTQSTTEVGSISDAGSFFSENIVVVFWNTLNSKITVGSDIDHDEDSYTWIPDQQYHKVNIIYKQDKLTVIQDNQIILEANDFYEYNIRTKLGNPSNVIFGFTYSGGLPTPLYVSIIDFMIEPICPPDFSYNYEEKVCIGIPKGCNSKNFGEITCTQTQCSCTLTDLKEASPFEVMVQEACYQNKYSSNNVSSSTTYTNVVPPAIIALLPIGAQIGPWDDTQGMLLFVEDNNCPDGDFNYFEIDCNNCDTSLCGGMSNCIISGLTPNTGYLIKIRTHCNSGLTSAWGYSNVMYTNRAFGAVFALIYEHDSSTLKFDYGMFMVNGCDEVPDSGGFSYWDVQLTQGAGNIECQNIYDPNQSYCLIKNYQPSTVYYATVQHRCVNNVKSGPLVTSLPYTSPCSAPSAMTIDADGILYWTPGIQKCTNFDHWELGLYYSPIWFTNIGECSHVNNTQLSLRGNNFCQLENIISYEEDFQIQIREVCSNINPPYYSPAVIFNITKPGVLPPSSVTLQADPSNSTQLLLLWSPAIQNCIQQNGGTFVKWEVTYFSNGEPEMGGCHFNNIICASRNYCYCYIWSFESASTYRYRVREVCSKSSYSSFAKVSNEIFIRASPPTSVNIEYSDSSQDADILFLTWDHGSKCDGLHYNFETVSPSNFASLGSCYQNLTTSSTDCCSFHTSSKCNNLGCALTVCQWDSYCCDTMWAHHCAEYAIQHCDLKNVDNCEMYSTTCDVDVESGKCYQYQIQTRCSNPLYNSDYILSPISAAKSPEIESVNFFNVDDNNRKANLSWVYDLTSDELECDQFKWFKIVFSNNSNEKAAGDLTNCGGIQNETMLNVWYLTDINQRYCVMDVPPLKYIDPKIKAEFTDDNASSKYYEFDDSLFTAHDPPTNVILTLTPELSNNAYILKWTTGESGCYGDSFTHWNFYVEYGTADFNYFYDCSYNPVKIGYYRECKFYSDSGPIAVRVSESCSERSSESHSIQSNNRYFLGTTDPVNVTLEVIEDYTDSMLLSWISGDRTCSTYDSLDIWDVKLISGTGDTSSCIYNDDYTSPFYPEYFCTLTSLSPATKYQIYVQEVCTDNSYSSVKMPSNIIYTPIEAPTNITLSYLPSYPNTSLSLSWTPASKGCLSFDHWDVTFLSNSGDTSDCASLSSRDLHSCTLNSLMPGLKYSVKIQEICDNTKPGPRLSLFSSYSNVLSTQAQNPSLGATEIDITTKDIYWVSNAETSCDNFDHWVFTFPVDLSPTYEFTFTDSITIPDISQPENILCGSSCVSYCDDCYDVVDLPFEFSFYDIKYSKIYISSNGVMSFSKGYTDKTVNSNSESPPNNFIALFWTDLNPSIGGTIYTKSTAQKFFIMYKNIPHQDVSGTLTGYIVLYKSGEIVIKIDSTPTINSFFLGITNPTRSNTQSCDNAAMCGGFPFFVIGEKFAFNEGIVSDCDYTLSSPGVHLIYDRNTTQCTVSNLTKGWYYYLTIQEVCETYELSSIKYTNVITVDLDPPKNIVLAPHTPYDNTKFELFWEKGEYGCDIRSSFDFWEITSMDEDHSFNSTCGAIETREETNCTIYDIEPDEVYSFRIRERCYENYQKSGDGYTNNQNSSLISSSVYVTLSLVEDDSTSLLIEWLPGLVRCNSDPFYEGFSQWLIEYIGNPCTLGCDIYNPSITSCYLTDCRNSDTYYVSVSEICIRTLSNVNSEPTISNTLVTKAGSPSDGSMSGDFIFSWTPADYGCPTFNRWLLYFSYNPTPYMTSIYECDYTVNSDLYLRTTTSCLLEGVSSSSNYTITIQEICVGEPFYSYPISFNISRSTSAFEPINVELSEVGDQYSLIELTWQPNPVKTCDDVDSFQKWYIFSVSDNKTVSCGEKYNENCMPSGTCSCIIEDCSSNKNVEILVQEECTDKSLSSILVPTTMQTRVSNPFNITLNSDMSFSWETKDGCNSFKHWDISISSDSEDVNIFNCSYSTNPLLLNRNTKQCFLDQVSALYSYNITIQEVCDDSSLDSYGSFPFTDTYYRSATHEPHSISLVDYVGDNHKMILTWTPGDVNCGDFGDTSIYDVRFTNDDSIPTGCTSTDIVCGATCTCTLTGLYNIANQVTVQERCDDDKTLNSLAVLSNIHYIRADPVSDIIFFNTEPYDNTKLGVSWTAGAIGCSNWLSWQVVFNTGSGDITACNSIATRDTTTCTLTGLSTVQLYSISIVEKCVAATYPYSSYESISISRYTEQCDDPINVDLAYSDQDIDSLVLSWTPGQIRCNDMGGSGGFKRWNITLDDGSLVCDIESADTNLCIVDELDPATLYGISIQEECQNNAFSSLEVESNLIYTLVNSVTNITLSHYNLSWVPGVQGCPFFSHWEIHIDDGDYDDYLNECESSQPQMQLRSTKSCNLLNLYSDVTYEISITEICVGPPYQSFTQTETLQRVAAYPITDIVLSHHSTNNHYLKISFVPGSVSCSDVGSSTMFFRVYLKIGNSIYIPDGCNFHQINCFNRDSCSCTAQNLVPSSLYIAFIMEVCTTSTLSSGYKTGNSIYTYPDPPKNVVLSQVSISSLSLSWSPGDTGCVSFDHWDISFTDESSNSGIINCNIGDHSTSSCTLTEVLPAGCYQISISEICRSNTIPYLNSTSILSNQQTTGAASPRDLMLLNSESNTELTLSWNAGSSLIGCNDFKRWQIYFSGDNYDVSLSCAYTDTANPRYYYLTDRSTTSCTVTGQPGLSYRVYIKEEFNNDDDSSNAMSTNVAFTPVDSPINIFLKLKIPYSNSELILSWTPGTVGCPSNSFSNWEIQAMGPNYMDLSSCTGNNRETTTCIVSGLSPSILYQVNISEICINNNFNSQPSLSPIQRTDQVLEPYNVILSEIESNSTVLLLSWQPGLVGCDDDGSFGGFSSWDITMEVGDGQIDPNCNLNSRTTTSCFLINFTPLTSQRVSINEVCSSAGFSSFSSYSNTQASRPSPPILYMTTSSNYLLWFPGTYGCATFDHYEVEFSFNPHPSTTTLYTCDYSVNPSMNTKSSYNYCQLSCLHSSSEYSLLVYEKCATGESWPLKVNITRPYDDDPTISFTLSPAHHNPVNSQPVALDLVFSEKVIFNTNDITVTGCTLCTIQDIIPSPYTISTTTYSWIDIAEGSNLRLDTCVSPPCSLFMLLKFFFPFYGNFYNSLYINSNGFITFSSATSDSIIDIPTNADNPKNFISLFYAPLNYSNSGNIYAQNFDDYYVLLFSDVAPVDGDDQRLSAEIILYANGSIILQYQQIPQTDGDYTPSYLVGIENDDGELGHKYFENVGLSNEEAYFIEEPPSYTVNLNGIFNGETVYTTFPANSAIDVSCNSNPSTVVNQITFDNENPTISSIHIATSIDPYSVYAKIGDTIKLDFEVSESLLHSPSVIFFNEHLASISNSGLIYSATYGPLTENELNGECIFTIYDVVDTAYNLGLNYSSTSDSSELYIDTNYPFATFSLGSDLEPYSNNDVFVFDVTLSEPALALYSSHFSFSCDGCSCYDSLLSLSPTDYQYIIQGMVYGESCIVSVDLSANSFYDDSGNYNTESLGVKSAQYDSIEPFILTYSIFSYGVMEDYVTYGDIVEVQFTASELLKNTIVLKINEHTISPFHVDGFTYSGNTTIDETDNDGFCYFSIYNVFDYANNGGFGVITTSFDSNDPPNTVYLDLIAPSLSAYSFESQEDNPETAKVGSTVKLDFTFTEILNTNGGSWPTVEIAGQSVSINWEDSYSGYSSLEMSDAYQNQGNIYFRISNIFDEVGNEMPEIYTDVDNNGNSVFFDYKAPKVLNVTIYSDEIDPEFAKIGSNINVDFAVSEQVDTIPNLDIGGVSVLVSDNFPFFHAEFNLFAGSIDPDGFVSIHIYNLVDEAGNVGPEVFDTSDNSTVWADTTTPMIISVSITSNFVDGAELANIGSTISIFFSSDEPLDTTQLGVDIMGNSAIVDIIGTNSYRANYTLQEEDANGVVSFTIHDIYDLAGNPVSDITTTTDLTSVTADTTRPFLDSVTIMSDNADSDRAAIGDKITLYFTSSENLNGLPSVYIANLEATALLTGSKQYEAFINIDRNTYFGTVPFSISFKDFYNNFGFIVTSVTTGSNVFADSEAPQYNFCPPSLSLSTDPFVSTRIVSWIEPSAWDTIDGVIASDVGSTPTPGLGIPGSAFPLGSTEIKYKWMDNFGNKNDSCKFNVKISDQEAPIVQNCPLDINTDTDVNVATAVVMWTHPTATDNVDVPPDVTMSITSDPVGPYTTPGSTFPLGTTVIFYEFSDTSLNLNISCSFKINVYDSEPPRFTCPTDIYEVTDLLTSSYEITWQQPNCIDNVDGISCDLEYESSPEEGLSSGSDFPVGVTIVDITGTDTYGNSDSCNFTVTIVCPIGSSYQRIANNDPVCLRCAANYYMYKETHQEKPCIPCPDNMKSKVGSHECYWPPRAHNSYFSGFEDIPLSFNLNVEPGEPHWPDLQIHILSLPINGSLYRSNITSGFRYLISEVPYSMPLNWIEMQYVPDTNHHSPPNDYFYFKVWDLNFYSNVTAQVVLEIQTLNDPPIHLESTWYMNGMQGIEQMNLAPYVSDVDLEDLTLTYRIQSIPDRGQLFDSNNLEINRAPFDFIDPLIYFDPNIKNAAGISKDYTSFTISAYDGKNYSTPATISINLICIVPTVVNVWSIGKDSLVCMPCPIGALCVSDGTEEPTADKGYWQSDSNLFLSCEPPDACPVGSREGTCNEGYFGRRCGECETGYYRLSGTCAPCPEESSVWVFIGGAAVVVVLLGFLFWLASKGPSIGFVTICFTYLQSLAIVSKIKLSWPSDIQNVFTSISLFNMNVELLSVECDLPSFSWHAKYIVFLVFPVIIGLTILLGWLLISVIFHIYDLFKETELTPYAKTMFAAHISIKVYILFLMFIYISLTSTMAELFDCTSLGDGSYMDADPQSACYDQTWFLFLPLGIFGIIIYGLGIPCLFVFLLLKKPNKEYSQEWICGLRRPTFQMAQLDKEFQTLRKDENKKIDQDNWDMADCDWLSKYGSLCINYNPRTYYWELFIVLRKLCFSFAKIFASSYPMFQATLVTLTLLFSILLQSHFQAFSSIQLNRLEFASLMSSLLILLSGIMCYGEPSFNNGTAADLRESIGSLMVFFFVVTFIVVLYQLITGFFQSYNKWKTTKNKIIPTVTLQISRAQARSNLLERPNDPILAANWDNNQGVILGVNPKIHSTSPLPSPNVNVNTMQYNNIVLDNPNNNNLGLNNPIPSPLPNTNSVQYSINPFTVTAESPSPDEGLIGGLQMAPPPLLRCKHSHDEEEGDQLKELFSQQLNEYDKMIQDAKEN